MKSLFSILFMACSLSSAFALTPEKEIWVDKVIRSSLAEQGIVVTQEEMITTGFGLQSITSLPIAVATLGHYRKSNVRIKVKVGEDKGTVTCKAYHSETTSEDLRMFTPVAFRVYNCRLSGIAEIPESVQMDKGYLYWPQQESSRTIVGIYK
jgi:hypothetical protein